MQAAQLEVEARKLDRELARVGKWLDVESLQPKSNAEAGWKRSMTVVERQHRARGHEKIPMELNSVRAYLHKQRNLCTSYHPVVGQECALRGNITRAKRGLIFWPELCTFSPTTRVITCLSHGDIALCPSVPCKSVINYKK